MKRGLTQNDIIDIEKRYDIAIYSIKWCSPRYGYRQERTRNTEKGVGFARWADQLIKYWNKKNR